MKFKMIFSLFITVSLFCSTSLMAADTLIKYTYSDFRSNRLGRVEIIDAVPERPTIFDIPDQVTEKNSSATLSFTIGDNKTSYQTIQVVQNRSSVCENTPDWLVRPSDFEYQFMITAELRDSELSASDCDLLGAFVGDELRGVTAPRNTPQGVLYFLQVWSNQSSGETVKFRYYDSETGETSPISGYVEFIANESCGTITDPCSLEDERSFCNVNPSDYEFNGRITAKVLRGQEEMGSEGDILAAFAGDECRGKASPDDIPNYGSIFFLQVWSNTSGEIISYKYYDSSEKRICDTLENVQFESDMMVGSISEPAIISLGDCTRIYDLQDVILVLKMLAGDNPSEMTPDADTNKDGTVGLEDAIYMLREVSSFNRR